MAIPNSGEPAQLILNGLNERQRLAVAAEERRILIIAGAGSGKTEVMARRIAWWVGVQGVPRRQIVAFTFTEKAAEEMKFRIRKHIQAITPQGEDTTLEGMYIGTIHSFCLKMLRELRPDRYHNVDIIDEAARNALIQRGYYNILGLRALQDAIGGSRIQTIELFARAYDLMNEYNQLDVELPPGDPPQQLEDEADWCRQARLRTNVGADGAALAFSSAAARFYAYLSCRRFLDFSTSQSELVRLLRNDEEILGELRNTRTHVVVDETQDINLVQAELIELLVGDDGALTAVGDHRQAIYRFRGSKVEIMRDLADRLNDDPHGRVYDLTHNYRSTPRILSIANSWANSITQLTGLPSPHMEAGNDRRQDLSPEHVAVLSFDNRSDEAEWIASAVQRLIDADNNQGAYHDTREAERGLTYSDIAILLRSSTDARTYMQALERRGIPAVFRAGPDLFAQPEVMLFIGALAMAVGLDRFLGPQRGASFPRYIRDALSCQPVPGEVIRAACRVLADARIPLAVNADRRLLLAAKLIHFRLQGEQISARDVNRIRTPELRAWLQRGGRPRRVFPQALYHWLLYEAGVQEWERAGPRGKTAMFHLGQLSSLIKGIETPGWNDPGDFRYQVIALYLWGARNARTEEAPLLVPPDAVTISTIHGAKGLEYAAVFLADVCARRFPNILARRHPNLPFSGAFLEVINPADLADNPNRDDERRLMYVALTRAERYLFITASGSQRSLFFRQVSSIVQATGGTVSPETDSFPRDITYMPSEYGREKVRLITSFSDLRYFLECPHDFYLRKVLGFAPTIDQAFGYGRGIHNLLRVIHSNPRQWSRLADDREQLEAEIEGLIRRGLFYLRYTTGEPRENMEAKAIRIVADYVQRYADELDRLTFEPEREFETLLPGQDVLVSGAIDLVRLDDPPRVTIIDFKSGLPESDVSNKLDEDEMRLQIGLYGLAAKRELEYQPDRGLVRYLGEENDVSQELEVLLHDEALEAARHQVAEAASRIQEREFNIGPQRGPRNPSRTSRCAECDFRLICGMDAASSNRVE